MTLPSVAADGVKRDTETPGAETLAVRATLLNSICPAPTGWLELRGTRFTLEPVLLDTVVRSVFREQGRINTPLVTEK